LMLADTKDTEKKILKFFQLVQQCDFVKCIFLS